MNLDEIQEGGCPEFWKKKFGLEPAETLEILRRCAADDWTEFWYMASPYGHLMLVVRDAYPDELLPSFKGEIPAMDFEYESPGECAVAVLKAVVAGMLDSEDPAFFKKSGRDLLLYWPFSKELT